VGGDEEQLALADHGVLPAAPLVDVLERHGAAEHVEDLVRRVVVEVAPTVRAADDHGGELRVLPDHLVADGRLEARPVLLDPSPQVRADERSHGPAESSIERRALSYNAPVGAETMPDFRFSS